MWPFKKDYTIRAELADTRRWMKKSIGSFIWEREALATRVRYLELRIYDLETTLNGHLEEHMESL